MLLKANDAPKGRLRQPHKTTVAMGTDDRLHLIVEFDDGKVEDIPYRPDEAEQLARMFLQGAMMIKAPVKA